MLTVRNARKYDDQDNKYIAVGLLPPHVHDRHPEAYTEMLLANGADLVFKSILELNPEAIMAMFNGS
jgi:HAD superfamily phosphatase